MSTVGAVTWKNFPRYMTAAMLFVVAVNVRFIMIAVTTFPGAASNDDFDTSNRYNAVMQAAAAQDALGWTERASVAGGLAAIDLAGAGKQALTGATVLAAAERPLGTDPAINLTFHETTHGHYVADAGLPAKGQYDLRLRISVSGHQVMITRRILVP